MKSIKELRKNNKKGFTLVELIVVLVILAILAALLIPTLTGYIDKAKNKGIIAETRQTVMAAQTLYDQAYAKIDSGTVKVEGVNSQAADGADVTKAEIAKLAEVEETNIGDMEVTGAKISKLTYTKGSKVCEYENGSYKVNGEDQ